MRTTLRRQVLLYSILLAGLAFADENVPEARFRGPLAYDFGVTNVKWEAATPEHSVVTFDLYWSYSWRAKWTEPAEKNVTGKPLEVENWDAAWVFVKFLPDKDSKGSIASNLWRHATLDMDSAHHVMPAGATNTVGTTDDGSRGVGLFVYRDAIGHGVNDFKGIKIRWLSGVDHADPSKAAVKVLAIPMVYVPAGAFKLGSGIATRIPPFPDGPNLPLLQGGPELGSFTDGSWRGGPVVPFLVDAEWNAPAAAGSRARRIGAVAGQLWGLGGYVLHCNQSFNIPHACSIGLAGTLNDDFPTGYEAFYCMKYKVTQGQYVEFLNSLPRETAARLATVPSGEFVPQTNSPYPWEGMGLTITDPARIKIGTPKKNNKQPELGQEQTEHGDAGDLLPDEPQKAAVDEHRSVYTARLPNRTCNYLHWQDGYAFAAWAGLRPMTELEFEKACRGPLNPVPGEHAWGSPEAIAATHWIDADLPTERCMKGNYHGWERNEYYNERATRAGIFATPESDRFRAGATYWGILDMDICTFAMSVASSNDRVFDVFGVATNLRPFRGSHGDGQAPAARAPGASLPPDWIPPGSRMGTPVSERSVANVSVDRRPTYQPHASIDGRSNRSTWRGVRSAAAGKRSAGASAPAQPGTAGEPTGTRTNTVDWDIAHDTIKVGNVKYEAGPAQYGTVSCDIEWGNSWRAKWTEPAEKNVTGKPLQVESWDAAWVFVKFRNPGDKAFSHAMLSNVKSDHTSPAGAALSVGLSDDGSKGLGVFIYRDAAGVGANAFKGLKLRWVHPTAGAAAGTFDPTKAELKVYAIPMVYVSGGPFQTKGPWGHPLTLISTGDATQPGGHRLEPTALVSGCWDAETDASQTEKRRKVGAVPKSDSWPNGYRPFYCTKYSITQGQYADFLNAQGGDPWPIYKFNRYTIRLVEGRKEFVADVPDRLCNHLSCGDIFAYTAWAGLRPLTDMEYEKACRGPRAVARPEDAWNAAACARADGLENVNLATGSPAASYWGIRELSTTGIPFEWPLTFHNELGLVFKGTHGNGDPKGREDWLEIGDTGEDYEDRLGWGTQRAVWIDPSHVGFIPMGHLPGPFGDRTGRHGEHLGRTAEALQNEDSPLQVTPLPNMSEYDVGIFPLAGRFRNDGAAPVKVEIAGLTDACFLDGAASRIFTAAPKSATPFKALVALTSMNAARLGQLDGTFPLQVRVVEGGVLAEQRVLLIMRKAGVNPPVVRSCEGGSLEVRVLNASDRPMPVSVVLDAVTECKPAETTRRAEIAAGKDASLVFPVPRQGFSTNMLFAMPFRVTVGQGVAQGGAITVNLLNQSRWWGGRKLKSAEPVEGAESQPGAGADKMDMLSVLEGKAPEGMPEGFFKMIKPPEGWKVYVDDATAVPLKDLGGLPARGSSAIAGVKVFAPAAREVKVKVSPNETTGEILRIWVNEKIVFDSRPAEGVGGKPFLLRAGMNTMAASWRSGDHPTGAAAVSLIFVDGKTGQPVTDLVLDIEGK